MSIVPMADGAIVESTVMDSKAVVQALRQATDIARPSTRRVCFAVSGNAVIMKNIVIPVMTEFELETQIEYEAEQYLPFDIDDIYLDFQILGASPHDPGSMEVLIVACKRDIIDDYQLVLSDAGLQAGCVDCCVFCLENVFELIHSPTPVDKVTSLSPGEEHAAALINIGASTININVICDGRTRFVRDQFYGGDNLTQEIMKAHSLSQQAAEQVKLESFSGIGDRVLEEFYVHLISDLGRSLDYYAANNAEHPINKMYLSGGCALIPGITSELEQRLGIATEVFNPFQNITVPRRKYDQAYIDEIGPRMVVPLGLALRSFDE
ncbi:MAG: type IV pilus assembly protein PilM, partial [Mariprofundaceae bacterium]